MKKIIYLLFIFMYHNQLVSIDFSRLTLSAFKTYAAYINDSPETDNFDWTDPEYTSLHVSLTPSIVERFLQKIPFYHPKKINMELFLEVLHTIYNERVSFNYAQNTVATLTTDNKSRIFVWGAPQGAFHSLMRCLNYLRTQDIIDDNLVIKNKNDFIVFTGDIVNRSAYSLEMLTLVMTLMIKNPNNIVYLKGVQETQQYWHNFGLKREIQIRGYYLSQTGEKFVNLIDDFFLSLPDILYINNGAESNKPIIVYSWDIESMHDTLINGFYAQNKTQLGLSYQPINTAAIKKSDYPISIQAIIRKEDWLKENRAREGLGMLDQAFGITCWAVCSCPTTIHKNVYNFNYDAFAVIKINESIERSTIELWNHAMDQPVNNFTHHIPYDITTGRITQSDLPTIRKKDITIGSTMSLEQGIPVVGQRVKQGMDVAINEQNKKGGINGSYIRLDIRYDKYAPNLSRINIKKLAKSKTTLILCPIGDPNLNAYIDYIKEDKILVLFPISGSPKFRQPDLKGIAHISLGFDDGVRNMTEYCMQEYASRQFGFLYQDDESGFEPIKMAHTVLSKNNIDKWLDIPYSRGTVNFSAQVNRTKESQIETLGLFSTSQATKEFLRQLDTEIISNKFLFGSFFLGDASFKDFAKKNGFKILLGARTPNPNTSELPIVKEYRAIMDKYDYQYDVFSLESYIATRFTLELLETIEGDVTHQKLREKIELLNNYNFGGFTYTFNPKTRTLGKHIWLDSNDDQEWIRCEAKNES